MERCKEIILNIETFYTETSLQLSREWDKKEKRDAIIEETKRAKNVEDLGKILLALDVGFCHPHALRYKEAASSGKQSVE